MKRHKLKLRTARLAISIFLLIFILSYVILSNVFLSKDEIIENEKFGEVVDWYEGHGYLAVLTKDSDEKVGVIVFEKKVANFFSNNPYFKSKFSNASYENASVPFKGQDLFIEFGTNKEAGYVEIIYAGVYANELSYKNGHFFRVLDNENDPYYDCPEQHIVREITLRDENGSAFETIPIQ